MPDLVFQCLPLYFTAVTKIRTFCHLALHICHLALHICHMNDMIASLYVPTVVCLDCAPHCLHLHLHLSILNVCLSIIHIIHFTISLSIFKFIISQSQQSTFVISLCFHLHICLISSFASSPLYLKSQVICKINVYMYSV